MVPLGSALASNLVPSQRSERLDIIRANGVLDGFGAAFSVVELPLSYLLAEMDFTLARFSVVFVVGVAEVDDVEELQGVIDVVVVKVVQELGFKGIASVNVLAKQTSSIIIEVLVDGV